ncbi:unnamed protein product [Phytophthora fragariaefolia]|uniref:Unnamed protein product n=1 Tax=Phytophthora fragariaefolia TaxID=1490495 RepID=A0A9W7D364_9STRA|nr:unnamed protein product [Phytophthora fragariaefolia]
MWCRSAFQQLLRRFARFYYIPKSTSRGRPPKLRYHHQALGLVLSFYVGSMEQSSLCMLFGVPPSTLSRTLRRAEESLAKALGGYEPARISWLSPTRQIELAKLVEVREPLPKDTFGFIDGKNFRVRTFLLTCIQYYATTLDLTPLSGHVMQVQQPSNSDLQNAMYNGWLRSVFVRGTICFAADGCIIWSRHNCPGSWNDSDTLLGFHI